METRFRYLFTFAFLFCFAAIQAQVNLRPGYIITNENDTVRGMIDYRTAERNALYCDFYPDGSSNKESYKPGDIYAYRFTDDGKFYVTRKVTHKNESQTLFLEYLIKGVISLYYYKDDATHFFFEDEEGKMYEADNYQEETVSRDGIRAYRNSKQYIGVMNWVFQNSDKTKKKISQAGFNKEDLSKITKEYHYETCEAGEACIEFENKPDKRLLKCEFNISAGYRFHTFDVDYFETYDMKAGSPSFTAGANFIVPRVGPSLSMQAEVEISQIKNTQTRSYLLSNTHNTFSMDALMGVGRLGFRYKAIKIPVVHPMIEAGLSYSLFLNKEMRYTSEFNGVITNDVDCSNGISNSAVGLYASAGIAIPWKKHSFIIQGLYEKRYFSWSYMITNKLSTYGASVGFVF